MSDQKLRYLHIERGRSLKQWFSVRNPLSGVVYNLPAEGYNHAILQVRDKHIADGGVVLIELTTENGGISLEYVADDGTGRARSGYIRMRPDATKDIPLFQDAVYDLVAISDWDDADTISRGPVMFIPDVSAL